MALSEKNRFKKFKPNKDENRYATELSSSIPQSYAKRARFAKKCLKKTSGKKNVTFVSQLCESYGVYFSTVCKLFQKS